MRGDLKADFQRYYDLLPPTHGRFEKIKFFVSCAGQWALVDYRFRKWLTTQTKIVCVTLYWPSFFFHILVETLTGIDLPTGTTIGKGFYIGHFGCIFISPLTTLGENCSISQGVTLGLGGRGETLGSPVVGDNVYFGAGCKVLGKIKIGTKVRIGANAVVLQDVPDGATAVGIPARIIEAPKKPAEEPTSS